MRFTFIAFIAFMVAMVVKGRWRENEDQEKKMQMPEVGVEVVISVLLILRHSAVFVASRDLGSRVAPASEVCKSRVSTAFPFVSSILWAAMRMRVLKISRPAVKPICTSLFSILFV